MEFLAAGAQESVACLYRNLLQRFQAVAGESRADQVDARNACLRQRHQAGFGIGFEPLGASQPRLKSDHDLFLRQPQMFG